ncbi:cell wall protein Ecm33 [Basidiobolus ranarum]|uniref:Cell wall protein Ecm33 n=1 Tax=Basidiobolus ranarum TaxID=34480 RepID=A0ABR2W1C4_9FUNG
MYNCKLLALLSLAIVANAEVLCQKEVVVKSAADLTTLNGCFDGVAISHTELEYINLAGLTSVGNLTVSNNKKLQSVTLPLLKSARILNFQDNVNLGEINIAKLTSAQEVSIINNSNLKQMNFPAGLEKVNKMDINNNGIATLDGLKFDELDTIFVAANRNLKTLALTNLTSINGDLTVVNNNMKFELSAPKLVTSKNLNINNVTNLNLNSLNKVSNVLDFSYNFFEEVELNVTHIGATLSFIGNSQLKNISFPELEEIGGSLFLANNSALNVIDGFKDLQTIYGSLNVSGPISNITLPDLKKIGGISSVKSSDKFDCATFRTFIRSVTNSTKFNCTEEKDLDNGKNDKEVKDHKDDKSDKDDHSDKKGSANTIRSGLAVVVAIAVSLFI